MPASKRKRIRSLPTQVRARLLSLPCRIEIDEPRWRHLCRLALENRITVDEVVADFLRSAVELRRPRRLPASAPEPAPAADVAVAPA